MYYCKGQIYFWRISNICCPSNVCICGRHKVIRMNQLRQILLLATGMILLVSASCRKKEYKVLPSNTPTDNTAIVAALNSLKSSTQTYDVTVGVYTEIRLSQGTKLKFYPYSFKDAKNNILTSGVVQVSVREVYGPGAGIVNRLANMSGNLLLKNGGGIYITGQMNGSDVNVNKYGVCFLAATHSDDPMALYYGTTGYEDSMTRWMRVGNMTGTAVQGTILDTQAVYYVDTSGTHVDTASIMRNYNQFDSVGAWGWIGCHYPYASSNTLTDINVIPNDETFNATNTAVFLVLPEVKIVIPVTDYNTTTHSFSLPTGYDVPADLIADLVVLSYKDGKLYYWQQTNFNISMNMSYGTALREYTPNEILNMLYVL